MQGKKKNRRRANLEETLAAAVKLHAEADAAGLTGAGELGQQSSQDGAGQGLLQQRGVWSPGSICTLKIPFFKWIKLSILKDLFHILSFWRIRCN